MYYVATDYQGSIVAIMASNGVVIDEKSYDPWGRLRKPGTLNDYNVTLDNRGYNNSVLFTRGYTAHEFIDAFELINMNGRVYDPQLARFLSPDNYIQDPLNSQSYNRYSYCINNPFKYTDPDGNNPLAFIGMILVKAAVTYIGSVLDNKINKHMSWENSFKNGNISLTYTQNLALTSGPAPAAIKQEFRSGVKMNDPIFKNSDVSGEGLTFSNNNSNQFSSSGIAPLMFTSAYGSSSDIPSDNNDVNCLTGSYLETNNPKGTIYGYNFKNQQFGPIPGLNRMYFDGTAIITSIGVYTTDVNGLYTNPVTRKSNVYGVTVYNGDGTSDVYIAPGATYSQTDLFITMGHEFVHVINNFWMRGADTDLSENAAYTYTLTVSRANEFSSWSLSAESQLEIYSKRGDFRYFRYNLPLRCNR
jgi:RHS repeat-associated protein